MSLWPLMFRLVHTYLPSSRQCDVGNVSPGLTFNRATIDLLISHLNIQIVALVIMEFYGIFSITSHSELKRKRNTNRIPEGLLLLGFILL